MIIKRQNEGIYDTTSWKSLEDALETVKALPFLSDVSRRYLEKKEKDRGKSSNSEILAHVLKNEGFRGYDTKLLPSIQPYLGIDFREKQWQYLEALAPWLDDGVILCVKRVASPDHVPGENPYWKEDHFYGFRVRDGKAFKLEIGLKDIDPGNPPVWTVTEDDGLGGFDVNTVTGDEDEVRKCLFEMAEADRASNDDVLVSGPRCPEDIQRWDNGNLWADNIYENHCASFEAQRDT